MRLRKSSEAAIRVGADGAEWLVWQSKSEVYTTARTTSFSAGVALDQWLARAARLGMKPRRVWLIAGAAECAHRRLTIPGTDLKVVAQAAPLMMEEELPLPLDRMFWTYRTRIAPDSQGTIIDVVATPREIFQSWQEALRERKLEIAGVIPEGPFLWQELAAIRASEIELLGVWGERRVTLIRGSDQGIESISAFVRGAGESWDALLNDVRRPFQNIPEGKTILSVFTTDRLRKRIAALPDLQLSGMESVVNTELFIGVTDQMSVPTSLLAIRRLRLEQREPGILFGDAEGQRPTVEFRKVATTLEVPSQLMYVAILVVVLVALWWIGRDVNRKKSEELLQHISTIRSQQVLLDKQYEALKDAQKVRADWGSVLLQLSHLIPNETTFQDIAISPGAGFRINGTTKDQSGLDEVIRILKETGYMSRIRVPKTEMADNKLKFQILADFDALKVKWFEVPEEAARDIGAYDAVPTAGQEKRGKPTPAPRIVRSEQKQIRKASGVPTPSTSIYGTNKRQQEEVNPERPRKNRPASTPTRTQEERAARRSLRENQGGTAPTMQAVATPVPTIKPDTEKKGKSKPVQEPTP